MVALAYAKNINWQFPALTHLDIAKEYVSNATVQAAPSVGTHMCTSIPYNTEENGIAECIIQTIMEGARTVLATSKLPDMYWPYAVRDIAFKLSILVNVSTG